MGALTAAAFMALASTCAPQISPNTLLAVARVESGLSPLAINDNTAKHEYTPTTSAEAVELATRLCAAGHNIDSGLLQINSGNWNWLGITLEQTFDPCLNIRAGATELESYSRYNTGSPSRGFANGYVAKIVNAKNKQHDISIADATPVPPSKPHDADVWREAEDRDDAPATFAEDTLTLEPVLVSASAPESDAPTPEQPQPAEPLSKGD
jgi:type IV secretion system protein VirB1